uniref:Uncharacterized protein n=1 Tax=Eutreptiella gymnastica TaxID=73025 RepID=A0A7S4CNV9_9EUGL|mmetsp:Transcript_74927/g.124771  ORF Transcript_74927/g.124771 Transcript_74927/m.124771 type:complete len:153 (+) Transcript_74927:1002-1460(+)
MQQHECQCQANCAISTKLGHGVREEGASATPKNFARSSGESFFPIRHPLHIFDHILGMAETLLDLSANVQLHYGVVIVQGAPVWHFSTAIHEAAFKYRTASRPTKGGGKKRRAPLQYITCPRLLSTCPKYKGNEFQSINRFSCFSEHGVRVG